MYTKKNEYKSRHEIVCGEKGIVLYASKWVVVGWSNNTSKLNDVFKHTINPEKIYVQCKLGTL